MPVRQTSTEEPASALQPVAVVAKYLSLSRSKVYALMDAGDLPYVKLGKSRRIRWEHVLQLVEQNTVGAQVNGASDQQGGSR